MTSDRPLVTGATGFAGSHLIERLLQTHRRVLGWSHRTTPDQSPSNRIEWRQVDLLDRRAVLHAIRDARPTVIFHCAGLPHVAGSWSEAAPSLQVNALGTHHLLDAVAEATPECTTVVIGSAVVYKPSAGALREDDPLGPSDPYATSKLAQELMAAQASTPVVVARPFNHVGPRQSAAFATSSFARQIAEIEAGAVEPRLLVGNLDARRDVADVRDTVRAYEALGKGDLPHRLYNVCAETAYRIGDLLELLLGMSRAPIRVDQDASRMRPSDNPLLLGDATRLRTDTGWRPAIPIEQTLADLLGWWRSQLSGPRS